MPFQAEACPRAQVHIASGDQDIGVGAENDDPLPPLCVILRMALADSMERSQGRWGALIRVQFRDGRTFVFPTLQCAQELGVDPTRLHIEPVAWPEH